MRRVSVACALVLGACGGETPRPPAPAVPGGLWRPVRGAGTDVPEEIEALQDLPYLRGKASARGGSPVLRYDLDRAFDGVNLVVSAHAPEAALVDMKGNLVHRWRATFARVWAEAPGFPFEAIDRTYWRRARVVADGGLVALFEGLGVVRLDRSSRVLWSFSGRCHDDLAVGADGVVYTLVTDGDAGEAILVLGADGEREALVSLRESLRESEVGDVGAEERPNALSLLDGTGAREVLVSLPEAGWIVAVSVAEATVTRAVRSPCPGQRDAHLLGESVVLLDPDAGAETSRVLECVAATGEITWSHQGSELEPFWVQELGACQRLGNGNTLIVESDAGRAFEVTREGDIVWEYFNPNLAGRRDERIAVLCDLVRLERAPLASAFEALRPPAGSTEVDPDDVRRLIDRTGK